MCELDDLVKKEYEQIKKQRGTLVDVAKKTARRYTDNAVEKVVERLSPNKKKEYWKAIEDVNINYNQTSWIRMALIRKLEQQIDNIPPPTHKMTREPNKKAAK